MQQREQHTIHHFSLANPEGVGQGDVPALLRSLANNIDALGEVEIQDITFHSDLIAVEDDVHFTVYYHLPEEARPTQPGGTDPDASSAPRNRSTVGPRR